MALSVSGGEKTGSKVGKDETAVDMRRHIPCSKERTGT